MRYRATGQHLNRYWINNHVLANSANETLTIGVCTCDHYLPSLISKCKYKAIGTIHYGSIKNWTVAG